MALDVTFAIVLLIGAWRGFRQGFAKQMLQLTGLGLGVVWADPAAVLAMGSLGANLDFLPSPLRRPLLCFAALFLIWLVVSLVGSIVLARLRTKVFGENRPSFGDRCFGITLGVVVAIVGVALAVFGIRQLPTALVATPVVKGELDGSQAVRLADDYRLIDRAITTSEFQRFRGHVLQVVRYFRPPDEAGQQARS